MVLLYTSTSIKFSQLSSVVFQAGVDMVSQNYCVVLYQRATLPYCYSISMATSSEQPLCVFFNFFWPKQTLSLSDLKNPFHYGHFVSMARFLWPVLNRLTGSHCSHLFLSSRLLQMLASCSCRLSTARESSCSTMVTLSRHFHMFPNLMQIRACRLTNYDIIIPKGKDTTDDQKQHTSLE